MKQCILSYQYLGKYQLRSLSTSIIPSRPAPKGIGTTRIPGKATPRGTQNFLVQAKLPLYHRFEKTGLLINPIIHGPPLLSNFTEKKQSEGYYSKLFEYAVKQNKSNAVVVYDYHPTDIDIPFEVDIASSHEWYFSDFHRIFNKKTGITREQIVTIANIGRPNQSESISKIIQRCCKLTGLDRIDMVYFEISDYDQLRYSEVTTDTLAELEVMVLSGMIQSFGVKFFLEPYIYHTPTKHIYGEHVMLPSYLESCFDDPETNHCDFVIYPISPTTTSPATYPMLQTKGDHVVGSKDDPEMKRKLTRISSDPLLCYRGKGDPNTAADRMEEIKEIFERYQVKIDQKIDEMTNPDGTPLDLEGKKKFKAAQWEKYTEVQSIMPHFRIEESETYMEYRSRLNEDSLYDYELCLTDATMPPPFDDHLRASLDEACPKLKTTPELQNKGLRIVFSVGIDAVIMDSETSVAMRKLTLSPKDLLTTKDTENIFGSFAIEMEVSPN